MRITVRGTYIYIYRMILYNTSAAHYYTLFFFFRGSKNPNYPLAAHRTPATVVNVSRKSVDCPADIIRVVRLGGGGGGLRIIIRSILPYRMYVYGLACKINQKLSRSASI